MSEKEFLIAFVEYLQERYYSVSANNATMQNIEAFLDKHHETYFEVEFIKKEEKELSPNLIVTDSEGKAIGELTKGVNTLYNQEGKVIGWSNLTQEELRKLYKDNS